MNSLKFRHIDFAANKRSKLIQSIKKGLKRLQVSLQKTGGIISQQTDLFFSHVVHVNPFDIIIAADCNSQNFNGKQKQEWWNRAALENSTRHIDRATNKAIIDDITFSLIVKGFNPLNKIITKIEPSQEPQRESHVQHYQKPFR